MYRSVILSGSGTQRNSRLLIHKCKRMSCFRAFALTRLLAAALAASAIYMREFFNVQTALAEAMDGRRNRLMKGKGVLGIGEESFAVQQNECVQLWRK